MRRIVYIALGFAAACGLNLYADSWAIRLIGIGLVMLLGALAEKKPGAVRRCFVTLLGGILGFSWFAGYTARYLNPISSLDGETIECTIRASDYSRETEYGSAVDGTVIVDEKSYRVTAYLNQLQEVTPGDSIIGLFRLRVTTDAGDDPSSYYQGKGIFLLAYQKGEIKSSSNAHSIRDFPAILRNYIQKILETFIPSDCVAFAKALLLGDTSGLSYQTDSALKVSGIRHVVAVSGLHISIFFAIISTITFRKRFLTALVGMPLLFLFAAVAGFTPSVTRACLMSGLMLTAQLLNKEYDGPSALAFAVITMLAFNPYCIGSVSFQLTVASVAGIFLFSPGIRTKLTAKLEGRKGKKYAFLRKLATGIAVTLGAQILTIPLCAYYFGMVSSVGAVTNLLVLWVVSLTFCLLSAVCVLAMICPQLAGIVGAITAFFIRYVLLIAKIMAAFPLAAVYTVSPYVTVWLFFAYLLLLIYLQCGKMAVPFACCAVLTLCLALIASWWEPSSSDVRFTVLDVGQGQCLLMQSKGRVYMVDCGGDSDSRTADLAAEALLSQGYTHVDGLILTHTDRDHADGVEYFLSRIRTDLLILPRQTENIAIPEDTRVVIAERDIQITDGYTKISIFAPVFHGEENEMSLCVLFDTEKCDILITGDRNAFGERSLLRHADIPDVDILIAGHHGSRYSTCEELLTAARPEIVCISVGADNTYGHPAQEVLDRLAEFGCTVYRTDQQGTITIRR
ncbi:MAG: DNA internalization-related competence protein ComEC/Rec2 [Eubacteriales bacterium]|nr:DNA internalization-related competence protein ComEC/Rec2 [Eubacteriales bacterium]